MPEAILIVEDNSDDAILLRQTLRQAGVRNSIRCVHSAIEAIAYLQGDFPYADREAHPLPKIIFLDLKLPAMDGFEFMAWLDANGRRNEFQILAISGLDDIAAIRRAYSSGAISFLPKPCTIADIKELIQVHPAYWTVPPPS